MNDPTMPCRSASPGRLATGASLGTLKPSAEVLEDVALLLHQGALEAWAIADREGITSDLHYLGLGVYLAQGNAVALLPPDHAMSPSYPLIGPPAQTHPGHLVRSAETRLRSIVPDALPGLSSLVLEVCDLAREFADHGY